MRLLDKFKRDVSKHRGKAAVLGVLFVAMVVLGIRAVLELRPREAPASTAAPAAGIVPNALKNEVGGAEAEARIQQNKALWRALREVKATAVNPKATFAFDASYYPPPAVIVAASQPLAPPELAFTPPPAVVMEDAAAKAKRIREQARALVVKSTAVGNGAAEPMAIVNQQLLTVGHKILGFEITAIRAREVEFLKEGVTTVVKMPDGQ